MCTRPKLMDIGYYRTRFLSPSLRRHEYKFCPCGMCIECRNVRREDYTQRLKFEIQSAGYIASFVSLSYRDDELPILYPEGSAVVGQYFKSVPPAYGSTLSRQDLTQFCDKLQKRWKRLNSFKIPYIGKGGRLRYKYIPKKSYRQLKYIAVGEYGDDGHRPHYHLIIVGLPCNTRKLIYDTWNKGIVDVQPVGSGCIRYTLSYIDKQVFGADQIYEQYGDFEPPFAHFSKGLGSDYIKQNLDKFDRFGTLKFAERGKSYTLNPYYRRKYEFDSKPYTTPFSDSVVKYANEKHLDLYKAYKERCEVVERSLQHKQIKKREPLYQCSKAIINKNLQRFKNKHDLSLEEQKHFTESYLHLSDNNLIFKDEDIKLYTTYLTKNALNIILERLKNRRLI